MTDYISMPDELPEKPTGWKERMTAHLNFGGGKGAGSFEITDDKGKTMPFIRQYNTQERDLCGFSLPGIKRCMTWKELRAVWPRWIERARKKQRERTATENAQVEG